jgi:hypothetical protein
MKEMVLVAILILSSQISAYSQQPKTSQTLPAQDAYRDLKPEDGIKFQILGALCDERPGQPTECQIGGLGVVGADGEIITLQISSSSHYVEAVNGAIYTAQFGKIILKSMDRDTFALTEKQIKQIKEFLAAQPKKHATP